MALGEEEQAQSAGAPGSGDGAAAVGEHGSAGRERERRDADLAPVDVCRLARPEPLQQADALFDQCGPAATVDAEHLELLVAVPDPDDVDHPAAAEQVDDGQILGQLHRLVEREQQGADGDGQALGARRDGRGERHGRGQVTVVGPVVLAEHGAEAAAALGPGAHLDGGLVQVSPRAGIGRTLAHAEPHGEHGPRVPQGFCVPHGRHLTGHWGGSWRDGAAPTGAHVERGTGR